MKPTKPLWRVLLLPSLATVLALAILLNLGFWQVRRLEQKEALIERVTTAVDAPAVAAPGPAEWEDAKGLNTDYRHVELNGMFEEGDCYYYTSLTKAHGAYEGPGYMVYTPFKTTQGWSLLVNRGFIPLAMLPDARRGAFPAPEGPRSITGLLRLGEKPNWTTPEPDLKNRVWFARDLPAMSRLLGVSDPAPYSVDLDAMYSGPDGLPQSGETVVQFKNDHLGYALTWFGLAATLVGVFLTYAFSLRRTRS